MTQEPAISNDSLFPPKPLPDGIHAFSERVHGLLDGQPKDDATIAKALHGMDDMFDLIAAGLYTMASMLLGDGEDGDCQCGCRGLPRSRSWADEQPQGALRRRP